MSMSMDDNHKKSHAEITLGETDSTKPTPSTIEQPTTTSSNQFIPLLHEAIYVTSPNLEAENQGPSFPIPSNPFSLEDNNLAFMSTPSLSSLSQGLFSSSEESLLVQGPSFPIPSKPFSLEDNNLVFGPTPSISSQSQGLFSSGVGRLSVSPFPMRTSTTFSVDALPNPTLLQQAHPLITTSTSRSLAYAPPFESLSMRSFSGYNPPLSDLSQWSEIPPQNQTNLSSFPVVQGGISSCLNPFQQISPLTNFVNMPDTTIDPNKTHGENKCEVNWKAIQSYLAGLVRPGPDIPRIYRCNLCRVEFPNAQAYGGHMSSHSETKKGHRPLKLAARKKYKPTKEGQASVEGKKTASLSAKKPHTSKGRANDISKDVKEAEEKSFTAEDANSLNMLDEEQRMNNKEGNGEDALKSLSDRDE